MRNSIIRTLGVVGVLSLSFTTSARSTEKLETVFGRIVAYDSVISLLCINGNGYESLVVQIEKPKNPQGEFIRIHFSYPCDKPPNWLGQKATIQKFRLIRDKELDQVLEPLDGVCLDRSQAEKDTCPEIRVWRIAPGAEEIKLPIGERIPSYRSAHLPYAPVL